MSDFERIPLLGDSAESNQTAKIRYGLELLLGLVLFVAELRCPKTKKGTQRGYFDDPQKMAESAFRLSGNVPAVYFTLNHVNPALLARAANKIDSYAANTTTDADIVSRRCLPLDFDPIRPAGISSTDEEHAAALAKAHECKAWLTEQGWPLPIVGDSGNGGHLVYRIELPNDEPSKVLLERALKKLSQKFSDDQVELDITVANASRIWKVYGTKVCKGDHMPELGRVHRYSQLLEVPDKIEIVSREQLEAIAALATESTPSKKQSGKVQAHRLDAGLWLTQHGVAVESQGPYQDGTKYILAECPLNPEHKRSAFVIQFASGALSAGCLHESCASLDWKTLRAMFEPQPEAPRNSEIALALKFVGKHGEDLRYTAAWNRWNWWTGTYWQEDETLRTFSLSRTICREAAMATLHEPAKARNLASASTVYAVERLARCDGSVVATAEQWDQNVWSLNTPAGTLDLRTGELRAHRREDFITKILSTSPGGECPQWKRFLSRITNQNPELESYLQRVFGYCATGSTRAQALFFCHGTGANGKTVLVNTMAGVLGPYCTVAPIETFMASRNSSDRHPTDLAGLRGARMVFTAEVEKGGRWAESKIKQLTGGDPITARFMRGNFFTFIPQFKLVIAGNHRPALRSVDEAIRRRFHLVPFTVTIPASERDPDLCEKLKREYPGILSWIIQGCLAWQREGLNPPACVREATQEYLADEDAHGSWIRECCVLGAQHMASSTALYLSWKARTEARGEFVGSQKAFSQSLESREGISKLTTRRGVMFLGIRLRTSDDAEPEGALDHPTESGDITL